MHIVVLNENEVALQFAVFAQMDHVLDVAFAVVVPRMGFARKNELDGTLPVMHQLHDVLELLEDERGAFVGREAARKTDRERVGIQKMIESNKISCGEPLPLEQQSTAGKLDQLAPQAVTQRPKFGVTEELRV